jgi:hypothetical protein
MATSKKKPARKPARSKPSSRRAAAAKKAPAKKATRKSPAKKPAKKTPAKSTPRSLPALVDALRRCELLVEVAPAEDVDRAIEAFRAMTPSVLVEAEPHVFRYYLDCKDYTEPDDPDHVEIASAPDVWKHVEAGFEARVGRRNKDGKVYVSVVCNCDWEQEHALHLVFEGGRRVNKVGAFDGHFTNADAYDDAALEGVVYKPR